MRKKNYAIKEVLQHKSSRQKYIYIPAKSFIQAGDMVLIRKINKDVKRMIKKK